MKRGMSKLWSVLLIATLVFTSASVAFADTEKEQAVGDTAAAAKGAALAAVQQSAKAQTMAATTKEVHDNGNFKLVTLKTRKDVEREEQLLKPGAIFYSSDDVVSKGYGYALPVTVPDKGTIRISAYVDPESYTGVYFGLYQDKAMTQPVGSTGYAPYTNQSDVSKIIQVLKKGTYYIGMYSTNCPNVYVGVGIAASYINGGNKTLTSGKEAIIGQQEAQTNYLKFQATKTGYMSIVPSEEAASYNVTLCNNKKKAVSTSLAAKHNPTFGVKKGKTYYIKVASRYNSNGVYGITATNKQIKEKSGTKKANAVTLKKNKNVKGTILAGSKQTDWYKIKLTKDTKIKKLSIKGGTNGTLEAKIYDAKGKAASEATASVSYTGRTYYLYTKGKLEKGTYYIKVYNPNKKYSGYYTLSWK